MSSKRTMKRERSRSHSPDRDYERKSRNDRNSRFSGERRGKSRQVYVSNISFDASYLEIKDEFSSVGEVTFVQMLKDDSNRFKGCAVITFKEPSMAQQAIETMNRNEFKGRKLVVKEDDANPALKDGSDRKRIPRGGGDHFDSRGSSMPAAPPPPPPGANYNTFGLSIAFLNSLNIDLPLVNVVFVANLDYTVTEVHLKELFTLAGKVVEAEIFKDKEGKSRGFGIVEFEHPVEAVQAISMLHNQTYLDRMITVRMDRSERKKDGKPKLPPGLRSIGMGLGVDGKPLRDIKSLPAVNQMGGIGGGVGAGVGGVGGLMDPSGSSLSSGPIGMGGGGGGSGGLGLGSRGDYIPPLSVGGLGNIIQISNLPLNYTSENLRSLCWKYGDVCLAEMRSQGTGMVKFRSDNDALRAVQMLDRQPFDGRILSARAL